MGARAPDGSDGGTSAAQLPVARVDLHCHSSASFDSEADVLALVRRAIAVGLTHLAITDHGTLDGAFRARDAAVPGTDIIVGEEVRTTKGDIIALFIERPIPHGLTIAETLAAIREQGGIAGVPHPFDAHRPSIGVALPREEMVELAGAVDYVEIRNGRLADDRARLRALAFAVLRGLAGIDASDAHTVMELGLVATSLHGTVDSADDLRACLERRIPETRADHAREAPAGPLGPLARLTRFFSRPPRR